MGSWEKMCKDYTNLAVDLAIAISDLLSRHLCLCLTLRLHCLEIDRIVKKRSQETRRSILGSVCLMK